MEGRRKIRHEKYKGTGVGGENANEKPREKGNGGKREQDGNRKREGERARERDRERDIER